MFHPHEFRHWSIQVGGLDLDAFASEFNCQLPDYASHYSSLFDRSFEGRRVWAFPPISLIRRFVSSLLITADKDSKTAGLLLVPVMPYASWWGMRKHSTVLTHYEPGERVLSTGSEAILVQAKRSHQIGRTSCGGCPLGAYSRTTHTAQLRAEQRKCTSPLLQSGRRVDITVEDLCSNPCGTIGSPIASDTRALMAADPDALRPLIPDPLGPVESCFHLDKWMHYH